MRYHWGLGIGHKYSHKRDISSQQYSISPSGKEPEVTEVAGAADAAGTAEDAGPADDAGPAGVTGVVFQAAADPIAHNEQVDACDEVEPEDQDLDYEGAEADSGDDYDGRNSNRDDEEELELYDTYNSD